MKVRLAILRISLPGKTLFRYPTFSTGPYSSTGSRPPRPCDMSSYDGDPPAGTPMTDDERAIHDLVATWMSASQAGDTATVQSLMTEDVIFMVPGREPFGKEVFAA